jgi:fructokinase
MSDWLPGGTGPVSPAAGPGAGSDPDTDIDVLAVGELVVDMVANGSGPLLTATTFTRAPGGIPAHVAAGVARLGRRAALLSLVGDDPFGRYLIGALETYGVDTTYIGVHPRGRTPVAFVSRKEPHAEAPDAGAGSGTVTEAQALFYREGGSDQLLSPEWVPAEAVARAQVVLGSGVSLAHALPRAALHTALGYAAQTGAAVAFDVNWQPALWQYPERARDLYHAVLPQVDILMLSSQELIMLMGGAASTEEGRLDALLRVWVGRLAVGRTRPLLLALTRGPAGCTYGLWQPGGRGFEVVNLPACEIAVKDRSGAGAAFLAGLLVALLDRLAPQEDGAGAPGAGERRLDLRRLTIGDVAEIFDWANASGALATTRRGALAGLPGRSTVLRLIKGRRSG